MVGWTKKDHGNYIVRIMRNQKIDAILKEYAKEGL